jgi:hypothetical protein
MSGLPYPAAAVYRGRRRRRFIPAADDRPLRPSEHPAMPSDTTQSLRDRRAVRRAVLGFAAVAVIAVGAFLGARAVARNLDPGTPASTVRDFLITTVADRDGVDACRYLTPHATRQVAADEPRDTPCPAALEFARLTLGRGTVRLESTIKGLSYRVEKRGDRSQVTVEADGAARTFELRKATASELAEFEAPPTPWRIDSGVVALVR